MYKEIGAHNFGFTLVVEVSQRSELAKSTHRTRFITVLIKHNYTDTNNFTDSMVLVWNGARGVACARGEEWS